MRSLRRVAKIVLVNLLVLVAGVIAIELCFGVWFGSRYDPRLRVIRDAEYRTDVRSLYGASGPAIYRRDQWGLRGSFDDPLQVDIVTIGGSTTDQRFLTEGATWQDRLAQRLEAMGHPVAIANAGIDGQSTVGHIAALKGWLFRIPRLHPQLVLVYAGINDVLLQYKIDYDGVEASGFIPRSVQYVDHRSAILGLYRTVDGMIAAAQGRVVHRPIKLAELDINWVPTGDLKALRDDYAKRLDAYEARLQTLGRLIRAWGAVPIFITQPRADRQLVPGGGAVMLMIRNGWMDPETRVLGLFNERTMSFCRRTGELCIDLAGELALGLDDFYDFNHNNPSGAAKIGDYLAAKVFDQLASHPNGDGRPQSPSHEPGVDGIMSLTNAGGVVGPDPLKARLDLWQKVWRQSQ
jgi:lysophospholipase L1-like esterase